MKLTKQPTKTYVDLLRDVFLEYQKEAKTEPFEAFTHAADPCKVLPFTAKDCPKSFTPTLIFKRWGSDENVDLMLSGTLPKPGHNEEIHGIVFCVHSRCADGCALIGYPDLSIAGLSHVVLFDTTYTVPNTLIIDLITRVQEKVATREYGAPARLLASIGAN